MAIFQKFVWHGRYAPLACQARFEDYRQDRYSKAMSDGFLSYSSCLVIFLGLRATLTVRGLSVLLVLGGGFGSFAFMF